MESVVIGCLEKTDRYRLVEWAQCNNPEGDSSLKTFSRPMTCTAKAVQLSCINLQNDAPRHDEHISLQRSKVMIIKFHSKLIHVIKRDKPTAYLPATDCMSHPNSLSTSFDRPILVTHHRFSTTTSFSVLLRAGSL